MIAAAVLAGLAAVLLLGPAPEARLRGLARPDSPGRRKRTGRGRAAVAGAAAFATVGVSVLSGLPGLSLWLASGGIAGATLWFLVAGQLRRRRERAAALESARAARVLAGLLASGQIPTRALAEAATECTLLAPAAASAALGADVGAELDRSSTRPGQAAFGALAAAWRLSERSGAPVAQILGRVAEQLRQQQRLNALIDAELAAARTSGHIMATLPFLAIALGAAVGVNSPGFLLHDPLGRVLLLIGVALTAAGVLWIDALARPKRRRR